MTTTLPPLMRSGLKHSPPTSTNRDRKMKRTPFKYLTIGFNKAQKIYITFLITVKNVITRMLVTFLIKFKRIEKRKPT